MTTIVLSIEREVEDGWREFDVEVTGTMLPYKEATQLDQEEGGYVEDIEATYNGEIIQLTPKELAKAHELLEKLANDDVIENRAARADYKFEEWLDRKYDKLNT
jgi:hypothetical protein